MPALEEVRELYLKRERQVVAESMSRGAYNAMRRLARRLIVVGAEPCMHVTVRMDRANIGATGWIRAALRVLGRSGSS